MEQPLIANLEAEQSVLGSILLDPASLDKVIQWLEPADFSTERNQLIFEYMRYLHEEEMPIEIASLLTELGKFEQLGLVTPSYVVQLANYTSTSANIVYYARIVQERSLRRKGMSLAKDIENLSTGFTESDTAYISEIERKLDEIKPKDVNGGLKHIKDTREEFFKHMETADDFIRTDSPAFDAWGGGYARKSLVIKAGRPGVGKTALELQNVQGIAKQGEGAAAIFSQEMSDNQVKQRMLSCKTGINYTRIRRKWAMKDENERKKLESAYDEIEKLPIYIKDSAGLKIQEIRSECRRLVKEVGKLSVIMVDYLSLMDIPIPKGSTYAKAVGQVVWACKMMAKEFDCVFILICMMGRSGEGTSEPKLSDLKESGDIEQHADMVEFLWVDAADESDTAGKVVTRTIAKGRDTGTGKLKYLFKGHIQRFEDHIMPMKEGKKK